MSGRLKNALLRGVIVGGLWSLASAQTVPAPEEDIREPRGLIEIPVPETTSYFWWWIGLAVLVAAALLFILWRWWLSRRPGASAAHKALSALRSIESNQAQLNDESFALQIADVLRTYVVAVYGIAAPQRTSEEFLQECLQSAMIAIPLRQNLREFLRACDLAKFAAVTLSTTDRQSLLAQVKDMVSAPLPTAEENKTESAA